MKLLILISLLALCLFSQSSRALAYSQDDLNYLASEFGQDAVQDLESKSDEQIMDSNFRQRVEDEVHADLDGASNVSYRANQMIDAWVKFTAKMLFTKGYYDLSDQLQNEYNQQYRDKILSYQFGLGAVGDHDPLSQWLADWYQRVEAALGQRLCHLMHIDDINTLNFTIPIVYQPCGDRRHPPITPWGSDEYKCHFVPYSGVVTFWAVWAACTAGTWGMGMSVACTPIAELSEKAMENYIAPPLSDRIYAAWVPDKCQR